MSINNNLQDIYSSLPKEVTLVAVSKTKPINELMEAYNAGQRIFGENKIQEMTSKWESMPKDIEWHMIGNIQRNKVKYMASFVSLIHGVDRFKLLKEINKEAEKHNRVIDCLLQIKIASEDSKFGMTQEEALALFSSEELLALQNVRVKGFMGMATFTDDTNLLSEEFQTLKTFFDQVKTEQNLSILSMGMSGDYKLAIEHGSTMVRIGSSIFGSRNYTL